MTEKKKSTQKILNWRKNKGATKAASHLDHSICDFPPPWIPALCCPPASHEHGAGTLRHHALAPVVPQSKARLLKPWQDSIFMPVSASLIHFQKPTVDYKSNHKRQTPPSIQTNRHP